MKKTSQFHRNLVSLRIVRDPLSDKNLEESLYRNFFTLHFRLILCCRIICYIMSQLLLNILCTSEKYSLLEYYIIYKCMNDSSRNSYLPDLIFRQSYKVSRRSVTSAPDRAKTIVANTKALPIAHRHYIDRYEIATSTCTFIIVHRSERQTPPPGASSLRSLTR